ARNGNETVKRHPQRPETPASRSTEQDLGARRAAHKQTGQCDTNDSRARASCCHHVLQVSLEGVSPPERGRTSRLHAAHSCSGRLTERVSREAVIRGRTRDWTGSRILST